MRLRSYFIARSITTESELIWDLIQKGCGYPNRNKAWKGVTVVASTGLHFRAFYLLTFAASYDFRETIDKDYCECGMPLETVRESEAPLKERSERV